MQRSRQAIASLIKIGVCAVLALGAYTQALAADASGTWTWTTPGRNGGPDRKSTLTLKVAGEKVTGEIAAPARGGEIAKTEITNGKIKGDEISFEVTREFNNNKIVFKYHGKVTEKTIKGKIETERNGQTRETDWEAKREEKK